jgi:hypothetical protein
MARKGWLTLFLGAAIILLCEAMLFTDVALSHRGPIHSNDEFAALVRPAGAIARVARWFAGNMTAVVWSGLLLLLDGILCHTRRGSPARRRPHHFWMVWIASIFIWCVFDVVNFWIFAPHHAWRYVGMPPEFADRIWGYVLAFAAVVPGMLLIGQIYLNLGWFAWTRTRPWHMPAWFKALAFTAGIGMLAWPLTSRNQVSNYTLWTSLVFVLDPINYALGRPSMLRDWANGWYGRTLAACAGGLTCGFLWEFWNYWAITKWVYDLPFLGALEHVKYFEMPLPGLLGFIPFGMECWVMWQTMRIPLDGLVEPLPDEGALM